jgi:hypothetical protein
MFGVSGFHIVFFGETWRGEFVSLKEEKEQTKHHCDAQEKHGFKQFPTTGQ